MNYLAFDVGASSGKLYLGSFDGSRLTLEQIHRFDNRAIPLGEGLYWDFLGIWHNMCQGIQKAWRKTEGNLSSFGVDTYSNDFSFIDSTGDLLSPMRCYRDARTTRCGDAIYEKMPPRELYRITGNQTAPFNTFMQLASMRLEGKDDILDSAHKLVMLPDLLGYYLTGEVVTEYTIASVTQMYDYGKADWSDEILEYLRIPRSLLGPITKPGIITGRAAAKFQESRNVGNFDFVSVCQHDTASAFLGSTCLEDCFTISSGTWSLTGTEAAQPLINDYGYAHNIANEGSVNGHHRLIRNVMGSWLLQEVRADYRMDGEDYPYDQLAEMAFRETPFAYVIDPDAPDFFQPGNMRKKIRRICGQQFGAAPETPGQFTRCICESLALKYRWAMEKLETFTSHSLPVVSMIGGGSRDALTCQFTANACGRPVLAGPADASALGNILVQMLAHGEISSIRQGRGLLQTSFPCKEYLPADTARWEVAYQDFRHRYKLD